MTSQFEKGTAFRTLHERGCFLFPNPWDAGSARILAAMGFKALATTSQGLANSTGVSDYNITRDLKLDHCRLLCSAVDLPIAADLENGFGHTPEICAETITLAAETGLVGGSIEDYNPQDDAIYDIAHAAERIRAAVEAANALPFPFTITGRAENHLRGLHDLKDTIRRLQAYQEAGAHVLYAPMLSSLDDVRLVLSEIDRPLNILGPSLPQVSVTELAEAGVRRISLGSALYGATLGALVSACDELLVDGTNTWTKGMISGQRRDDLMKQGTP